MEYIHQSANEWCIELLTEVPPIRIAQTITGHGTLKREQLEDSWFLIFLLEMVGNLGLLRDQQEVLHAEKTTAWPFQVMSRN